jgi:hypothetical protein
MWENVATIVCEDRLSSWARDWLRLHRAVARREERTMKVVATRLLASAAGRGSRREIEYLLAAGLTGALAGDDHERARHLAARFATFYPPGNTPPFYLTVLLQQTLGVNRRNPTP